jgi:hypothetical protein
MKLRRLVLPLTAAVLALPGTALAKDAPPPSAPPVLCDHSLDGTLADGSTVFSNQAGDAGCITVRVAGSTLRLYDIALTPGWTYDVKSNGEGTNSRVLVDFSNPTTGGKVEARIEFGKTWIR